MKKFFAVVLTIFCVVILFTGCSKESAYKPTEVENVSISISNVSSTGATVMIKDINKEPFVYGEWYKIEKEKDGEWYDVKTVISSYAFNDLGYLTDNTGEVKFTIDWEWLYGKLPSGNYRLLKEVASQYISIEFCVTATEQ